MAFTIGIVAHIKRLQHAEQLADQIDAQYISVDDGTLGCNLNHRKVWQHLTQHNTEPWTIVLEDDAVPIDEFTQQLTQALAVAPANIVSLYLGRGRPHWQNWPIRISEALDKAKASDTCWIVSKHLLHGVGIAIRTPLATTLVNDMVGGGMKHPIDTHINLWAQAHNEPVAYTVPSLIDHADLLSLAWHEDQEDRLEPRKAWVVGGNAQWTRDYVVMEDPNSCVVA